MEKPKDLEAEINRTINGVIVEVVDKYANPKPIPVAKEPARIGKRPKDGARKLAEIDGTQVPFTECLWLASLHCGCPMAVAVIREDGPFTARAARRELREYDMDLRLISKTQWEAGIRDTFGLCEHEGGES